MQAAARQALQEPSLHPNPTLTYVTKPGGRRGVVDETLTDPNLETGLTGNRLACDTASETVAARSPVCLQRCLRVVAGPPVLNQLLKQPRAVRALLAA